MLDFLHSLVWGIPTAALLCAAGAFLLVKIKFLPLIRPLYVTKRTFGRLFSRREGVSPFAAMATALGGTIGTGNIVGVATALTLGGAGAIFWMWISAVPGMATKYAEVFLAVKHRRPDGEGGFKGGPMYVITHGMGSGFRPLAAIFSVLCIAASFGIGNTVQINSAADALNGSFGLNRTAVGAAAAIIVLICASGGTKRIAGLAGVLVPFMAALYIAGSLAAVGGHMGRIPGALGEIVSGAFGLRPAAGGIAGFGLAAAVRAGVSRGIFTNEAGMGSAPIAHASAASTPHEQGCWGIMEVFIDTIVVCTLTALVILTSDVWQSGTLPDGARLTSAAFAESLGGWSEAFLAVAVSLFAFASVLGWSHYGKTAVRFLWVRPAAGRVYMALFAAAMIAGANIAMGTVWAAADILNGLMIFVNMLPVIMLSGELDCAGGTRPKKKHIAK